jgi:polysaccharide biosynthesis transport protein
MQAVIEQIKAQLYSIWLRRWHGLAVMWAACLLGWGVVAAIPDEYEASARIFVDTNDVLAKVPGASIDNSLFRQVEFMRRTLVSRPNLDKVIRRTDLDLTIGDDDTEMDKLITKMTENIGIQADGDDLFTITYRSGDSSFTDQQNANVAKRVVQNLINIFVEGNLVGSRESFTETQAFLDQQIENYERQLEQAEQRRAEFERKYIGFLPGGGNITQRLQAIRTETDQLDIRIVELQSQRRVIAGQLASVPSSIPGNTFSFGGAPMLSGTEARINALEQQISDALARGWTDQHPDVLSARRQIDSLRKQLASERASGSSKRNDPTQANPLYMQMRMSLVDKESELSSAVARRAQLNAEIAELTKKSNESPEVETERSKLNRDYDVIFAKHQELLKSREETKLANNVTVQTDRVQFRIVDPPEVPLKPAAPNRPLLLSVVMAAALGLGLAVSFVLSQARTTFPSVTQLRLSTDLPVLGSISMVTNDQQRSQSRLWLGVFAISFVGLIGIYLVLLVIEIAQASTAI